MNDVVQALRSAARVAVVSHRDPDGDTVGSAVALALGLESAGKRVSLHCRDVVPQDLRFLAATARYEQTPPPRDADVVVTVDLGERSRADLAWEGGTLINIDHHGSNTMFGDLNLVDPTSAASGEMVARVIDALGVAWTPEMATATLTALMTDTGSFQFPNTDPRVLHLAARMRESGADVSAITYNIYRNRPYETTLLWGAAFSRMQRDSGGLLVWTHVDRADLERSGAREEQISGLVEQVARTSGSRVAFLFSAVKAGQVRISCRTSPFEPQVDASALMARFGGGGHARAAGSVVPGDLESVKARVLDEARAALAAARAALA